MVRKMLVWMVAGTMLAATVAPAFASPNPPTNAGNGAGNSGQCTGPADERPGSCQSSH